jgi:hypothetical protein
MTEDDFQDPELDSAPASVADEIASLLKAQAGRLLEGAAADLQPYAVEIGADAAQAAALGRDDLLRHLSAQTKALGEKNRLRGSAAAWGTLSETIYALGRVALVAVA